MGKFGLQIKANLENVTDLETIGDDYQWLFKFKCTSCGEESGKFISISEDSTSSIPGSRGEAHLVFKCRLCSRQNTVDIIEGTKAKYTAEDSEGFKTIISLECRGVEPVDFSFNKGFRCKSMKSSKRFDDVDLEEGEWVEYDEGVNESVGVYEVTHRIVKL